MSNLVNKIFLGFVFITPCLPRPTAAGPERYVVPLAMLILISAWVFAWPKRLVRGGSNMQLLVAILGFSLAVFLTRILTGGSHEEISFFVSRFLFSVGVVIFVHWFTTTDIPTSVIFKYFVYGFALAAMITIFAGVTGVRILEEDSIKPSRFLGFYKTTGIFRSFGEFGIMGAVAWVYLLVYFKDFSIQRWLVLSFLVLAAMLIAQSRNVYLVIFLATVLVVVFRATRLPGTVRTITAGSILLVPVMINFGLPILQSSEFGAALIGAEGSILDRNVDYRFDQFSYATSLFNSDMGKDLMGYSRQEWRDNMIMHIGHNVAPHNHFLSNLVFLGFLGGGVWIIGLYLMPVVMLFQTEISGNSEYLFAGIVLLTTVTGLSFYEGFFSVVVMLAVANCWASVFGQTAQWQYPVGAH